MPLNTRILRNDEPLKMPHGWNHFHVAAMTLAAAFDSGQGPFEDNTPEFAYEPDLEGDLAYLAGKTQDDYPEIPCPVSPRNCWDLVGYHILATTPLNYGRYTLKRPHKFLDTTDGEILELLPGDILIAFRD